VYIIYKLYAIYLQFKKVNNIAHAAAEDPLSSGIGIHVKVGRPSQI
jgi:hypothetical protein